MPSAKAAQVVVRPKRQVTLPKEICDELDIGPGDVLELAVEGSDLVAKPKKSTALRALQEIREAFKRSGISEEELLDAGRRMRQEITRDRDAANA
ncbi:MAG: AbrB/MazE/SpoVT family DNA-binding domain-containing protein [Chloroflexi bacterium]|nr:AbrB/MazE/SpoVT family DNA-binding domain-containing protein [Chloroflexota bacterium]